MLQRRAKGLTGGRAQARLALGRAGDQIAVAIQNRCDPTGGEFLTFEQGRKTLRRHGECHEIEGFPIANDWGLEDRRQRLGHGVDGNVGQYRAPGGERPSLKRRMALERSRLVEGAQNVQNWLAVRSVNLE